jgi:hypothetical protein
MQTGSHEENAGQGSGFAMAAGSGVTPGKVPGLQAAWPSGSAKASSGGVRELAKQPPRSAFLGLRVAMPLALLLWGLVVTALWILQR